MEAYEAVIAAIADPTRRAILERLRTGPRSVGELAAGLPVTRPAVSQHLAVLRRARLVYERADGTRRIYAVDATGLGDLRAYTERFWSDVLAAYGAAAGEGNRKGKRP